MAKSMQITRACDYACRALVYLARHDNGPIETARIARETEVPAIYLRKIFQVLSRGGVVRTTAGTRGGVSLAKRPEDVTLRDIIETMEGPIILSECVDHPESCGNSGECKVRESLSEVQGHLVEEFGRKRLSDLV